MKKNNSNNDKSTWIWLAVSIIATVSIIVLIFGFSSKPPRSEVSLNEPSKEITETPKNPKSEINTPPQDPSKEKTDLFPKELIPLENRASAPDFTLEKIDQGQLTLSNLKGNIVLLDFTTTWCYWCDVQAPQIEEVYNKYKNGNFTVISIDCKEDLKTVRNKYPQGKHIFPVVLDYDGSTALSYGIPGYPTFFLLDKNGKIAYTQSGYKENMKDILQEIIEYINNNE